MLVGTETSYGLKMIRDAKKKFKTFFVNFLYITKSAKSILAFYGLSDTFFNLKSISAPPKLAIFKNTHTFFWRIYIKKKKKKILSWFLFCYQGPFKLLYIFFWKFVCIIRLTETSYELKMIRDAKKILKLFFVNFVYITKSAKSVWAFFGPLFDHCFNLKPVSAPPPDKCHAISKNVAQYLFCLNSQKFKQQKKIEFLQILSWLSKCFFI